MHPDPSIKVWAFIRRWSTDARVGKQRARRYRIYRVVFGATEWPTVVKSPADWLFDARNRPDRNEFTLDPMQMNNFGRIFVDSREGSRGEYRKRMIMIV